MATNQKRKKNYSEPVQEIMGAKPSWIVRWGITVIFAILVLSLIVYTIFGHVSF